jgi:hypothetical protein
MELLFVDRLHLRRYEDVRVKELFAVRGCYYDVFAAGKSSCVIRTRQRRCHNEQRNSASIS